MYTPRKPLKSKQIKGLRFGRKRVKLVSEPCTKMRLDREEAQRRLNSPNNLANTLAASSVKSALSAASADRTIHSTIKRGRQNDTPNTPEFLRDAIGHVARSSSETQVAIGAAFGVSQETVSNYKTGQVGGVPPNEERRKKLRQDQEEIKDTALVKLMASLNLITQDKLEDPDDGVKHAAKLARIATDMGKVVHSLSSTSADSHSPVSIHIYSPEIKSESKYKVIDV